MSHVNYWVVVEIGDHHQPFEWAGVKVSVGTGGVIKLGLDDAPLLFGQVQNAGRQRRDKNMSQLFRRLEAARSERL